MRGLAARELHRELPPRLDRDRVVQDLLDLLPAELVHEAHLVGVHEAGVAHHVAAVREVDGEDRAAAVLDRARAVVVEALVGVGGNVATRKGLLEVPEERGVDRHHVFEVAVLGAVLDHQDPAVLLDDLRLDLSHLAVAEDLDGKLTVEDLLPHLGDAPGAERVRFSRPPQGRLRLLRGLQERLVRPAGSEGRVGPDLVQRGENAPGRSRRVGQPLLDVLHGLVHRTPPAAPSLALVATSYQPSPASSREIEPEELVALAHRTLR